ncbi:hypothetical protein C8D89_107141 [Actinomycetospora cinnamomea]|uniref:Uncharacterized protein n=1 Tax=Actinomycetospora cinnamomea TaxID=663609 RepID=A0A2U1FA07_9PSEU|nr:hypothetical protein C8D89_107141 [Actinomycetospora cinnamomea]
MASSTDSCTLPDTSRVYTPFALRACARLPVPGHGHALTSAERKLAR